MRLYKHVFAYAVTLTVLLGAGAAYAAAPQTINYQGYYRENGAPYNGSREMVFKITDSGGLTVYWTSGDTTVTVSTGVFHVVLAPASVDWGTITPYLEVTIEGETLLPREALASSVYALYASTAQIAQTIIDGAVTTVKLADNAVTSAKIADGAIIAADIAVSTISLDKLNQSGCTDNQIPKWSDAAAAWVCAADGGGGGGADIYWTGTAVNLVAADGRASLGLGNVTNEAQIAKSVGTTAGDIIYFTGANTPVRLGVGSNGQVLALNAGLPAWQANTASGLSESNYSLPGSTFTVFNVTATSVTAGNYYGDGSGLSGVVKTETDTVVRAITGLVKSNGSAISAALAGTDYMTPTGNGTALQFGSGVLKSTFTAVPDAANYALYLSSGLYLADGGVRWSDGTVSTTAIAAGGADIYWTGTAVNLVAADGRASLGLGNVNNTADLDKPISTTTVTALALKADLKSAVYSVAADTSLTPADFGKTITVTAAATVTLPSVDTADIGVTITIVKLASVGAGTVIIKAGDSTDRIADSSLGGTIYNNSAAETYATITLRLTTGTMWSTLGGNGSWTTN